MAHSIEIYVMNYKVNEMLVIRKNILIDDQLMIEYGIKNYSSLCFTDSELISILSLMYRLMLVISLIFLFSNKNLKNNCNCN